MDKLQLAGGKEEGVRLAGRKLDESPAPALCIVAGMRRRSLCACRE